MKKDKAIEVVNLYFDEIEKSISNPNITNSNTNFFKDPHEQIAIKLKTILPRKKEFATFWSAIDSQTSEGYSKAVRLASTITSPTENENIALKVVTIFCEFKTQLSISLNEKNSQGKDAIDYARQKGNLPLEKFLESQIIKEKHTLSTINSNN